MRKILNCLVLICLFLICSPYESSSSVYLTAPASTATIAADFEILQFTTDAFFFDIAWSSDFEQFAVASCHALLLFSASGHKSDFQVPYKGQGGCIYKVAFGPSNNIAFATSDRIVEVWNVDTQQKKVRLSFDPEILFLAFNADESILFAGISWTLNIRWHRLTGH